MPKKRTLKIGNHTMQQLPSGSYRVRIEADPVDGKRTWVSFTDPDPQVLIEKVTLYKATRHTASKLTFGKATEEYIKTCELAGLSPSTIVGYNIIYRNGINLISSIPVDELKVTDIQRQINSRVEGHAPKTVKNEYGLIHKVLMSYAPKLDLTEIKLPKVQRKRNQDAGIAIPTDDQLREILAKTKARNRDLYLAVLLASLAGMRRSEIYALNWADIDKQAGTIAITKAIVKGPDGKLHLKDTKSEAGYRTITIGSAVINELEQYRGDPGENVVNMTPSHISDNYRHLKRTMEIPGRFHDLRHYHCSVLIMLGIPKEYIMSDMGHSTETMYQRVYAHLFPDAKKMMYEEIAQHAQKILACDTICDTKIAKPL